MKLSGFSVTVARPASSRDEWFDSMLPLRILPDLPSKIALEFRKEHVKSWIIPGSANYNIGVCLGDLLFGVLCFNGFSGYLNAPKFDYDIFLIADTTPSGYINSTELLLYVLRTQEVKECLEKKFMREINTIYSKVFSKHPAITRYRKHAKLETKKIVRINNDTPEIKSVRRNAYYQIRKALKQGVLTKTPCEVCGKMEVEAHHKDYSQPLLVNWLCHFHHDLRDAEDKTSYVIVGYDLGYIFQVGSIPSLKEAKSRFINNGKIKS